MRIVRSIAAIRFSVSSMRVPGRAAHVELDQAGVDGREEVAAEQRHQRERAGDEQRERADRRTPRCCERPREPAGRTRCAARSKRAIERTRRTRFGVWCAIASLREQVAHHRRHERARQQVRHQHREHDRERRAARTATSRRRSGTRSARTRCRCTASTRTRAPRSAARRRGSRCTNGFRWPMLRWMFSISTVASSTSMPTASARPPSVITLSVSPSACSTMIENRIDSGIEMTTVSVDRQLPRNSRIISAGQPGGDQRLAQHAVDRRAHEHRLIEQHLDVEVAARLVRQAIERASGSRP